MEMTQIGPMEFVTPLIAAATSATARLEDLRILNDTAIGGIITKSATMLKRAGNPETNYFTEGDVTINAQGLPGPDLLDTVRLLEKFSRERTKPVILSIAGMNPAEYAEIVSVIAETVGKYFDAIELNLSCPNVAGKPIISYDHDTALDIADEIAGKYPQIPFGLKLAPHFSESEQTTLQYSLNEYLADHLDGDGWKASFGNQQWFDRDHLRKFAQKLFLLSHSAPNFCFVSATNTLPNCRIIRPNGQTALHPQANGGQGGLSGHFLRDISIANVKVLSEELPPQVKIIGTGGVDSANVANQYLQSGASAVAIGTALINRGPRVIQEILLDL